MDNKSGRERERERENESGRADSKSEEKRLDDARRNVGRP